MCSSDLDVVTALMLAAINEDSRFLQKLLEAGADVHAMDYKGRTALDWAMENPSVTAREANVKMLKDAGGDKVSGVSDENFLQLCRTGSSESVSKAIQAGSNVNAQDRHGTTVATVAMSVNLPHQFKGTHMSRFVEILNGFHERFTLSAYQRILEEMKERLDAGAAHLEMAFPYFFVPDQSGAKQLVRYECRLFGTLADRLELVAEVRVPVAVAPGGGAMASLDRKSVVWERV